MIAHWPQCWIAPLAFVLAFGTTTARAQYASSRSTPFVAVPLQEIQRLHLSPVVLTLWSYLTAESRVTESQGFGLSAVPHFGGAKISTVERFLVWGTAGAALSALGASAPSFETIRLPPEPVLTFSLGAVGGIVAGEFVWRLFQPDRPRTQYEQQAATLELTVVAVRLERLTTPIALPEVTYAWVPAVMGKW